METIFLLPRVPNFVFKNKNGYLNARIGKIPFGIDSIWFLNYLIFDFLIIWIFELIRFFKDVKFKWLTWKNMESWMHIGEESAALGYFSISIFFVNETIKNLKKYSSITV